MIYDPLHRRHVHVPAIPRETKRHRGGVTCVEAFLNHVTDKEKQKDEDHLSFRVICNVYTKEKIWAYIFSSSTGQWRACTTAFAIGEYVGSDTLERATTPAAASSGLDGVWPKVYARA